jgi:hypothetical protein
VLQDAEHLDVDRWWALGDLVLFGPRPAEVLEILLGLPVAGSVRDCSGCQRLLAAAVAVIVAVTIRQPRGCRHQHAWASVRRERIWSQHLVTGTDCGRSALEEGLMALRCPLCAGPLRQLNQTLLCEDGHAFDAARRGYVNGRPRLSKPRTSVATAARRVMIGTTASTVFVLKELEKARLARCDGAEWVDVDYTQGPDWLQRGGQE